MILKVFGVLQVILIQIISAQLSNRDLVCQNALNYLGNTPLAGYGRSRRQIDKPLVGEPGSGDLSVNGFAHGLPFRNGMPFGNLPRASGLTNNFALHNGLANNLAFNNGLQNSFGLENGMALPNTSPFNLPFLNMNIAPQNRMVPNLDGININGLPFNIPDGLPSLNKLPNGLPGFNNMPHALPGYNNVPNALPSFNNVPNGSPGFNNVPNGLPSLNDVPSAKPGFNNVPNGLPSLNNVPNGLPGFNNVLNGLPGLNNVPNALPGFNNVPNGLPSLNNVPNRLPSLNNVPNALPSFNKVPNGLPSFNNMPNGLPSLNNIQNTLPSFNNVPNGLPSFNRVPNGLPGMNNMPNALPSLNNVPNALPSLNNVPNALPGFNNVPNGLPSTNNMPFPNNFLNLNNVPVGQNILNLINNVPAASLRNINNKPIPNDLPSFNALSLAQPNNGLPQNFPSDNLLPPINNQLPYLNDFRITGIIIGDGTGGINRFPRNGLTGGNMLPIADHLLSGNVLAQQVADELSNINDYQTNNGFASFTNTPPASTLANNMLVDNRFSSSNNFPKDNGLWNFAVEAQNINNMQLNNDLSDISNVQNYNVMPINEERFFNNVPFNNDFADANYFPADTGLPNAKSRLVNAINNGMPLSNGGYLNDILFADNGIAVNMLERETYPQNTDGNNLLPEGVQMFSNVPSDHQSVLMPNNLNLAQELIKNLKIDGNVPFLNGLPVAGITETVTVLNGPCSK